MWSPYIHLQTRRSREKSEACSLVYSTLALVLHWGHLAGSHLTIPTCLPTTSHLPEEATRLTPPIIQHLQYYKIAHATSTASWLEASLQSQSHHWHHPHPCPPQVLRYMSVLSITLYTEYSYHQKSRILLEKEYSLAFSREQKRNAANRSGRESLSLEQESRRDLITKREFHPAIHFFLILFLATGSEALLLAPFYVIALLLFNLENFWGYMHITTKTTFVTTCIVPRLRRVPCFEAPIHMPRPRNPSPQRPPPYVRAPHVILEDETDKSLSS